MNRLLTSCFLLLVMSACCQAAQETNNDSSQTAFALDFDAIANALIQRMDLQEKESVVFLEAEYNPVLWPRGAGSYPAYIFTGKPLNLGSLQLGPGHGND